MGRAGQPTMIELRARFVREYVRLKHDAIRAYMLISQNCSRSVAKNKAPEYLNYPLVQQELRKYERQLQRKLEITVESQLAELEQIKQKNMFKNDRVALGAFEIQNKLLGLYVVKTENKDLNLNIELNANERKQLDEALGEIASSEKKDK